MKQKYITPATLYDSLGTGFENARTAQELADLFGTDRRTITLLIAQARQAGLLICSSNVKPYGYFIPGDPQEVKVFYYKTLSRLKEIQLAIEPSKQYLDGLGGV